MTNFEHDFTERETQELTIVYFCVCPFCGLSRKTDKTQDYALRYESDKVDTKPRDEKRRIRFDKIDIAGAPFIDVRVAAGRGRGFPRITEKCLSLKEAMTREEYEDLIRQIKEQARRVLHYLEKSDQNSKNRD